MTPSVILDELLKSRESALTALYQLGAASLSDAVVVVRLFLDRYGANCPIVSGFCQAVMKVMCTFLGKEAAECFIVQNWAAFGPQARENVAYRLLSESELISNDCAFLLLRQSSSSLLDKKVIIESLVRSRHDRALTRGHFHQLLDDLLKAPSSDEDLEQRELFAIQVMEEIRCDT